MVSQLITDPRGLLTSVVLRLSDLPVILILSVYAPPSDKESPQNITSLISVLVAQYRHRLLIDNFNALLNHALDSDGVNYANVWPWLSNAVNSPSLRLIDTFRNRHPSKRQFSRFPSSLHPNQTGIYLILGSVRLPSRLSILSAEIDVLNKFSDQHSVSAIPSTPPLPTTHVVSAPSVVFYGLTKEETTQFSTSISNLDNWIKTALPIFDSLSTSELIRLTDLIIKDHHQATQPQTINNRKTIERIDFCHPPSVIPRIDLSL